MFDWLIRLSLFFVIRQSDRVRTGHGKPGKSWNLIISFSRPGKSWNLIISFSRPGKSWNLGLGHGKSVHFL